MSAFIHTLRPYDSETITVSTVVKQLTQTKYDNTAGITTSRNYQRRAGGASIENTSANTIRYTEDGTTPVAGTTGKLLKASDIKYLESYESIVKIKMVREGASDGTVDVEYYR